MRFLAPALVCLLTGCVTPPVTLDLYRGVLATHFDGIPEGSAVCALLTNRGARPVDWVRLRMRGFSTHGERGGRWASTWLYAGRIESGETRAVRLEHPPVVDQMDLRVVGSGPGSANAMGRPVVDSPRCSEAWLRSQLARTREGRAAPGWSLVPIVRRNDPPGPVIVAKER